MDPASAAVAAVGFAGSLVALLAVAIETTRGVYSLWGKLKEASSDARRLLGVMRTLDLLVDKIKGFNEVDASSQGMQDFWGARAELMLQDLEGLNGIVKKLGESGQGKTYSKKHLRKRIRKIFADDDIESYERRLSRHVETLNFALSMVSDSRGISNLEILREIRASQKSEIHRLTTLMLYSSNSSQNAIQRLGTDFAGLSHKIMMLESGLVTLHSDSAKPPSLRDHSAANLARSGAGRQGADTLVRWKWSRHNFPFGTLAIGVSEKRKHRDAAGSQHLDLSVKEVNLAFAPPSWIARHFVKIAFAMESAQFGGPGFKWSLSQVGQNGNKTLARAVQDCQLPIIKDLLSSGLARPTDFLGSSGRSMLHEIVFSHLYGVPGSLDTCRFLIEAGADLNARSLSGSTPLLLACNLMRYEGMQSLVSLLLEAGADPTTYDSEGRSAISMIFDTDEGLLYLQSFFYRYIDLIKFQQLGLLENWIVASLARSLSEFQCRLTAELEQFHTPASISSHRPRHSHTLVELDVGYQVSEMWHADAVFRTNFLRVLCRRGTAPMLEPLLKQGIDVNEVGNTELSYLGEAATTGNSSTLSVLLKYGAQVNDGTSYSALDSLLERWIQKRETNKSKMINEELPMFEQLLETPHISSQGALIRAIVLRDDHCISRLLASGFGRKEDDVPKYLYRLSGCEAVEAVKHKNGRALELLVEYDAGLEYEDRGGYTALIHALDKGYVDFVKILVNGGAKLLQQTSTRLTAWDVARRNVSLTHPRKPSLVGTFAHTENIRAVTYEDDIRAFALLHEKLKESGLDAPSSSNIANLLTSSLHAIHNVKVEGLSSYREFREKMSTTSPSEVLLVALGLSMTVMAFLFYNVYEALLWTSKTKRVPRLAHVPALAILSVFLWALWNQVR